MRLSSCEKEICCVAVRNGVVGLSDVMALSRCDKDRARFLLSKLVLSDYLEPAAGGGFVPLSRAFTVSYVNTKSI